MRSTLIKQSTGRKAVAALFAASTLTLTACGGGTAGDEAGADVENVVEDEEVVEDEAVADTDGPYDGIYDSQFYDEVESYVGGQHDLLADVGEVITSTAFTIAGTDDTTVDELLVVGAAEHNDVEPEVTVEVTGTVMDAFVLTDVEEELDVDLDDALFEEFEDQRYVMAEGVEVLEDVDPA